MRDIAAVSGCKEQSAGIDERLQQHDEAGKQQGGTQMVLPNLGVETIGLKHVIGSGSVFDHDVLDRRDANARKSIDSNKQARGTGGNFCPFYASSFNVPRAADRFSHISRLATKPWRLRNAIRPRSKLRSELHDGRLFDSGFFGRIEIEEFLRVKTERGGEQSGRETLA
jgi:hypothetical protein